MIAVRIFILSNTAMVPPWQLGRNGWTGFAAVSSGPNHADVVRRRTLDPTRATTYSVSVPDHGSGRRFARSRTPARNIADRSSSRTHLPAGQAAARTD